MSELPEINQERFAQILEQIRMHPEMHDQSIWEQSTECGTTRCAAGWAVHNALVEYGLLGNEPGENDVNPRISLNEILFGEDVGYGYYKLGRRLLGLTHTEAEKLFHASDNEEALELIERYALKGRGE